jgi:signal transduction histidine kinase
MRLSEFILSHRERILSEWVEFARSCTPSADMMTFVKLRDHAAQMLETIAADLNTYQSKSEQVDKSKGKLDARAKEGTPETPAESHGSSRAKSGFTIEQMVSEYRALRASVIRLWVEVEGEPETKDLQDVIRFNEAIDQALAEATSRYTQDLNRSNEMFLAMLSHDLRTPVGAILGSASVIKDTQGVSDVPLKMASLIVRSSQRMTALIDDLLDFTRSRLGQGFPIARTHIDIAEVCRQTVDEIAALHPQHVVNLEACGELQGEWDAPRLSRVLSNLISNAVQYGSSNTPINVTIHGSAAEVVIAVQNWGPLIPANELTRIFDPMHRIEGDKPVAPRNNLGLGLYIADEIVAAHGGTIAVESSEENGTTFTIRLSKRVESRAA